MIAGAPSGFAHAEIQAIMDTEFGIHGAELNDSKSPPPIFSSHSSADVQLSASEADGAGPFFSGSADGDAFSSKITSIVDSHRWSLHENASTKANKRTPRKPTDVTVVRGGDRDDCTVWNCLTISWTPQAEPGKPIREYVIEQSNDGSTWTDLFSFPFPGGATRYRVDPYDPPGTTYYLRIRNRDDDGWGPWSDVVSGTVRAIDLYPVEGLRVHADGIHQHRLGWVAPTDRRNLNEAGFKQYTIEWSSDNISYSELGEIDLQFSTEFIHRSNQLTPGKTFYYRVKVTNTKNEVSAPSEVVSVTAATSSGWGIPTGITATRQSGNSVEVSWTAATDLPPAAFVRTYRIFATTNGGDSWERSGNSAASSFLRTGLQTDTCYGFRVDGIYTALPSVTYHSDLSDEVYVLTGDVTAPIAPTALSATDDGMSTFTLSWTAPASDPCSPITGYQIQQSTDRGSNWTDVIADTGNDAVTYAHTSQTLSTTRQYRVGAINAAGTGVWSNVVRAGPAIRPAAPTGLIATAPDRTSHDLSWTAPTDDGGAPITGYQVEASPTGNPGSFSVVLPASFRIVVPGFSRPVSPGTTAYYRVRANNSAGLGAPSNVASATTEPISAPAAPTSLTATADGSTTINLSWTAPTSTGGAAITGYQIESSPTGDTWMNLVDNTRLTTTTYAHTGLSGGTTVHYRVSAINSAGPGIASQTASATTAVTAPDAPTSLTVTADGQTTINLSWTAPTNTGGAAITGYQIESSPTGDSWTNLVDNTGLTTTTYAHTGLTAGTTVHYRVSAINSEGPGAASNSASATTVITAPAAPTSLTATADGQTIINLSWTAPTNTGGAAITGYQIESSPTGDSWTNLVDNTRLTTTTYAHTGLSGGTTVHYRVSAINSAGTGIASQTASATTAVTAPAAPTSLTATADGQTTINLSWTAPTNTGGAAITGYQIESSPTGDTWTNLVDNTGLTTTTYAHTGLSAGTTVHYRVSAINSEGPGAASNSASATTSTSIVITAPAAPTSLTATADGSTTINLSWTAPTNTGGAAITGYQIESSPTAPTTGPIWRGTRILLRPPMRTQDSQQTPRGITGCVPSTRRGLEVRQIQPVPRP